MQLYRNLLRDAWRYTSTHPSLWVLGFFLALLSGTTGELDSYFRYVSAFVTQGDWLNPTFWSNTAVYGIALNLGQKLAGFDVATWIFVVLFVVAAMMVVVMVAIAHGGLIFAAANQDTAHFDTAFATGWKHVGPLVVLDVGLYLVLVLPLFVFSSVIVHFGVGGSLVNSQTFIFVTSCLFFFPYLMVVSLTAKYASHAIVLQNLHLGKALVFGWKLFWKNWLVSIEMAIVVFVVGLIGSIAIVLISVLAVSPYLLSVVGQSSISETVVSEIYNSLFIGMFIYLLALMLFSGIYTTWQWAAWTALYQRLLKEKPTATLFRALSNKKA